MSLGIYGAIKRLFSFQPNPTHEGDRVHAQITREVAQRLGLPEADGYARVQLDAGTPRSCRHAQERAVIDRAVGLLAPQGAANLTAARATRATQRPQGAAPATASSPSGQARQFIANERQRTEREKFQFSGQFLEKVDKFNSRRAEQNQKHHAEAGEIRSEIAKVHASGKSEKDKSKDLAKLRKKLQKTLDKIKPPIDPAQTTRRIDQIMSDSSLSAKQKKAKVEALRKELGLPEKGGLLGGLSMKAFADRLGDVYARSKDRVEKHGAAQKKALEAQLSRTEAAFGKESPQAVRLRAEINSVDKLHRQEAKRLDDLAESLKDLYPSFWRSLGKFFSGVFKVLGSILGAIAPILKMIPGVGQIVGLVVGGVQALSKAISGDWKGALGALAGAIPGGELIGSAISTGLKTVGKLASGDIAGAFGTLAGGVPGVGDAVDGIAEQAVGGLSSAIGVSGETVSDIAGTAVRVAEGDLAGAAGSVAQAVPGLSDAIDGVANQALAGVSDSLGHSSGAVKDAVLTTASVASDLSEGRLGSAAGTVAGLAGASNDVASVVTSAANAAGDLASGEVIQAIDRFAPEVARSATTTLRALSEETGALAEQLFVANYGGKIR